jgi:hypothetical protein
MIWRLVSLLFVLYFSLWSYPQNPGPSVTGAATSYNAISYTGNKCGAYGGSSGISSENCTITVANTGDTLLIFVFGTLSGGFTVTGTTIACGTGSSLRSGLNWATTWYMSVLYVPNATAGSCNVKTSFSSTPEYVGLQVLDIARANTSTPVDNSSCTGSPYCSAHGTSTSPSASITTANNNEMVVAELVSQQTSGATAGSGYTYVANSLVTNETQGAEYGLQALAGSYSPGFTTTNNVWFVTAVALTK